MPLQVQGLVSRVDVACQTEDNCAATAEELEKARTERSALQRESSSLRFARIAFPLSVHATLFSAGALEDSIASAY